ncbi:MAG: hypothetical protein OCC49_10370 [Fibrobacterales bacterium]
MSGLVINNEAKQSDDFFLVLQYDSTHFSLPFPYAGFKVYLNDVEDPFCTLTIDSSKVWNEKIDFKKFLKPGTYNIKILTCAWEGISRYTNAIAFLKLGDDIFTRTHLGETQRPFISFPEWESFAENEDNSERLKGYVKYWDEWNVVYEATNQL